MDDNGSVEQTSIWQVIIDRLHASLIGQPVPTSVALLVALGVAGGLVWFGPAWRLVRIIVTVVHELGHAVVGVACGRKFTGLVINPDMSGHTSTRGRTRGPGLVLATAAGYPMPAITGTLIAWAALAGRASLMLLIGLLVLLLALFRARSCYTAGVLILLLAGIGCLWWSQTVTLIAAVVCGAGVVLVLGGWRHLWAVIRHGDPQQDPAVLARLTRLPTGLWNLVFSLVNGLLTAWLGLLLAPHLVAVAGPLLP